MQSRCAVVAACAEILSFVTSEFISLDWISTTKFYLINVDARNLVIYIKIINSVALLFGNMFEISLRSTVLSRPRCIVFTRFRVTTTATLFQVPSSSSGLCRVPVTTGPVGHSRLRGCSIGNLSSAGCVQCRFYPTLSTGDHSPIRYCC